MAPVPQRRATAVGFSAESRIWLLSQLGVYASNMLADAEQGVSDSAWAWMACADGHFENGHFHGVWTTIRSVMQSHPRE